MFNDISLLRVKAFADEKSEEKIAAGISPPNTSRREQADANAKELEEEERAVEILQLEYDIPRMADGEEKTAAEERLTQLQEEQSNKHLTCFIFLCFDCCQRRICDFFKLA